MNNGNVITSLNTLECDIWKRYNCICSFIETSPNSNKFEIRCQFKDAINSSWTFTYVFNIYDLITNYNSVLGKIIIELEEEWMNRIYRI